MVCIAHQLISPLLAKIRAKCDEKKKQRKNKNGLLVLLMTVVSKANFVYWSRSVLGQCKWCIAQ